MRGEITTLYYCHRARDVRRLRHSRSSEMTWIWWDVAWGTSSPPAEREGGRCRPGCPWAEDAAAYTLGWVGPRIAGVMVPLSPFETGQDAEGSGKAVNHRSAHARSHWLQVRRGGRALQKVINCSPTAADLGTDDRHFCAKTQRPDEGNRGRD